MASLMAIAFFLVTSATVVVHSKGTSASAYSASSTSCRTSHVDGYQGYSLLQTSKVRVKGRVVQSAEVFAMDSHKADNKSNFSKATKDCDEGQQQLSSLATKDKKLKSGDQGQKIFKSGDKNSQDQQPRTKDILKSGDQGQKKIPNQDTVKQNIDPSNVNKANIDKKYHKKGWVHEWKLKVNPKVALLWHTATTWFDGTGWVLAVTTATLGLLVLGIGSTYIGRFKDQQPSGDNVQQTSRETIVEVNPTEALLKEDAAWLDKTKQAGSASDLGTSTSASSDVENNVQNIKSTDCEGDRNLFSKAVVAPGAAIPSIRQSYPYYRYLVLIPLTYAALLAAGFGLNLGGLCAKIWVSGYTASGPALRLLFLLSVCITPLRRLAVLFFRCHILARQESRQLKFRHMVVIPAYKEPHDVLKRTLESLPKKSDGHDVHIVLAMEAKDITHASTFHELDKLFGKAFASFHMTVHTVMPCERPCKASNENYALRTLRADMMAAGMDLWDVMVTVCDADSVFAPDFFNALESAYFGQIDGRRLIYSAPRNTYRNFGKLWNPLISAVECSMNSSDFLADFTEPYVNFSNYSILMGYAVELDFWDPEVIPEDFHVMYKAMICSNGAQSVCRVWSLIANDTVTDFHDRYVQAKRHLWGVTTIAWLVVILKHAPFSVDRILCILLKTYAAEMSEALTPSAAVLLMLIPGAWRTLRDDSQAFDAVLFLGAMILLGSLLQWLVFFIGEALVWRRQMANLSQDLLERPSWCQVVLHYGLMPLTCPIAHFIFGNVACWHSVCNAFWSSEFEYVTAPKA